MMKNKSQYLILMMMPLCFALITLFLRCIEMNHFKFQSVLLNAWGIMWTVGLVIVVPVYLIILNGVYVFKFNFVVWRGFVFSSLAIMLNAATCFPYSVLCYITHGKYVARSMNDDIDFFPIYTVIPILIVGIATAVMKIVAVVKSKQHKR